MLPEQLVSGHVYFEVCYEDRDLKCMFIQSYQYLGKEEPSVIEPGERAYQFRQLNSDADADLWEFTTKTLYMLHDLPGLIDHLARIQRNGPGRAFAPDAS